MRLEAILIAGFLLSSITVLQTGAAFAVTDLTPPTISITAPSDGSTVSGAVSWTVQASDNVGVNSVMFFIDGKTYAVTFASPFFTNVATTALSNGPHTWLAIAYDVAGNEARAQITVTANNPDTTGPTTTILNPLTGTTVSGTIDYIVRASDINGATKVDFYVDNTLVGTDTTAEFDSNTNTISRYIIQWNTASVPNGLHTLLAKSYDRYNNMGSRSITVSTSNGIPATDTTAPLVTVPANVVAEATSTSGATVTFAATATDNIDGSLTPTCTPSSGSTFPIATTTVICSATDAAGNTGTASFTVTVRDTTAPTLSLPSSMTVEATSTSGATVTFAATATDLVDGSRTVTCTPSSGSMFPLGTTTVLCSASDTRGNSATGSFSVTIQDATAPLAPLLSSPVSGTRTSNPTPTFAGSAEPGAIVRLFDGSATTPFVGTLASGTGTWSATPTTALSSTTHSITAKAVDAAGNVSPASAAVSITIDAIAPPAPVISTPASGSTTNDSTPTFTGTAEASSTVRLYDGSNTASIAVTTASSTGSWSTTPSTALGSGVHSIAATATDAVGNTSPKSAAISITITAVSPDTTAPVVTVPSSITTEATSASGAVVTFAATATDNIDGTLTATCTPASGSTFPIATLTVNCSATDAAGNTGTASFTVTVRDSRPPTLSLPSSITTEATSASGAVVTFAATATDLVDGSRTVTCTPASGSTFTLGTTTVLCSASDTRGNSATGSFTISVKDTTAPTVSITSPTTGQTIGGMSAVSVSASDKVGLSYVELYIDGNYYGTDSASPYTFSVDTTTLPDGQHQFNAKAIDKQNNAANSQPVSPTVQNSVNRSTPPTVSIDSPLAGSTVKATVPISISVSDSDGVGRLEIYVDGVLVTTLTPASATTATTFVFNWDSTTVPNGSHTITATAFDGMGTSGSDSVSLKVQNKGTGGKGGPKPH